ncbi:TRAP transporter small permease [Brucella anthropi]|uniref:TRAP transporter small permease n=1 Tax=Brucella anthropi TaxID=529 RepID=UPI00178C7FAF|nr:TRAP transporter small permease subunit [Brucella anthropi]
MTLAVIAPRLGLELPDEDLLVSEAVVAIAFLPQLLLVTSDRQLSVDVFTTALPERAQKILAGFAQICGILAFVLLGWAAWLALDRALDFGSVNPGKLRLPEWPARTLVVLGCLGGLLGCVMRLVGAPVRAEVE